jgi:hypothetical protein
MGMKTRMLLGVLGGLAAGCAGSNDAVAPPDGPIQRDAPAPEWVELFNGRDLTGWEQRGGQASYSVQDGCIVGASRPNQPNSFLCTTAEFGDFELELDFKADDGANSGIQFRSLSLPEYQKGRVHGYQAEIDTGERAWTAGIYDEGRRGWLAPLDTNPDARAAYRHNEWNHVKIVAVGDRLCTWLNGVPAAHLHDSMTARGFIALQVHDVGGRQDELRVCWKNLRLKPL